MRITKDDVNCNKYLNRNVMFTHANIISWQFGLTNPMQLFTHSTNQMKARPLCTVDVSYLECILSYVDFYFSKTVTVK